MNIYNRKRPINGTRIGIGFRSKNQLPLIMVWREWWCDGEVCMAKVLFSS